MFTKILVCSDGSDRAISAAKQAADLAVFHGAELTLLHVCQIPNVQVPFPGAPSLAGPTLQRYICDMHAAVVSRTLPVIEQAGAHCEILEEAGDPADVIARVANQQDFDLIVLGSRGISTERAQQLGSVCHGVIHNAFCPVLIIR